MDNLISIGKMAEINHTTIATLRLYDKKGLLKPRYIDDETGYRYYSVKQNYRLDMISYMKDLGMSLNEIKDIFNKEDIMLIEDILSKKNEQLHKQMRALKARHNAVERAIESIERYRKSPTKGIITLEYIDRRNIWAVSATSNFYENGIEDFEQQQNKLREKLIEKGVIQVHSYNICTSINKINYLNDNYNPDKVFVTVDNNFEFMNETSIVDSGMYACIYLDNFDEEISYAKKLKEYCKMNNYIISGDYICEVMTEFNIFDSEKRSMFLRLQVPVEFN